MATGTVKRVEATNGFGLIVADDGNEYLFHRGGIKQPLKFDDLFGGERVSFEVEADNEGPRAVQVSKT